MSISAPPAGEGDPPGTSSSTNSSISIKSLRCWQLNLQRSVSPSTDLNDLLVSAKHFIALVQEPNFYEGEVRGFSPTFNIYTGSTDRAPRAAIILPKHLNSAVLPLADFSDRDLMALMVNNEASPNCTQFVIASVYLHGKEAIPSLALERLTAYCNESSIPLILGGDVNAHHSHWGCKGINPRGIALYNFIISQSLVCCNVGDTPTFHNAIREEILDMSLTNSHADSLVSNWTVSSIPSNSDHALVTFKISFTRSITHRFRNVKKTDWDGYKEALEGAINRWTSLRRLNSNQSPSFVCSSDRMDQDVAALSDMITTAYEANCPYTFTRFAHSSPWWNEDLSAQRVITRKLLRKARRTRLEADWTNYRDSKRLYKNLIQKSKNEAWRKFCTNTDSPKSASYLTKVLRKRRSTPIPSLKKPDGSFTHNQEETLQFLLNSIIPSVEANGPPAGCRTPSHHVGSPEEVRLAHTIFNSSRMDKAIKDFEPFKSPGPDHLYAALIQSGWDSIKLPLQHIFISSFLLRRVPKDWCLSTGVVIPKPGKETYTNPKAFRIINLSSFLLKLMEKLILWYLNHDMGMSDSLSSDQFGFRRGHSTEAAIHKLVSKIEESIIHGNFALGIFLDIEGAFDNIAFRAIERALYKAGVPAMIISWIHHLIRNRIVSFSLGDFSTLRKILKGFPQGGILSPFLWNIVIEELIILINSINVNYLQAFADDLVALFRGIDICPTLSGLAQRCLDLISSWCTSVELNLSTSKTKVLVFTWKRKWSISPHLTLYGSPLPLSSSVKYLGVTLDTKLNWSEHIQTQCKKAKSIQMMCQRAMGPSWGPSPNVTHWIYTAITRPIISYACISWFTAVERFKANALLLNQVQLLACRCISGCFSSTPQLALEALLNIPPLPIFIHEAASRAFIRLSANNLWVHPQVSGRGRFISHSSAVSSFARSIDLSVKSLDLCFPSSNLDIPFRSSIEPVQQASNYEWSPSPSCLHVFTDGSKLQQGDTGAGFTIFIHGSQDPCFSKSISLNKYCTVFQAELAAISNACLHILESYKDPHIVNIFSDSQAAIRAISSDIISTRSVLVCRRLMGKLTEAMTEVNIFWIPGHKGIEGNELADGLAKAGALMPEPTGSYPIPMSIVRAQLRSLSHKSHVKLFSSSSSSSSSKGIFKPILSRNLLNRVLLYKYLSRTDCRYLTYVLTGHAPLNYFLHKIGKVDSPFCEHCKLEHETVVHFLCHCPAFSLSRLVFLGDRFISPHHLSANVKLQKILGFIKATRRFVPPDR